MSYIFPESELIITPEGAIYHLNIRPEELADTVILVGDPERVPEVSKYFDAVDVKVQKREFTTHTGRVGNKRISCVATGIGCDNIDIVLNELDALVNIDFATRAEKAEKKSLNLLRIGTTGSLHKDLPLDSWVTSAFAVGLDGLLNHYEHESNEKEVALLASFLETTNYPEEFARPYVRQASENLLDKMSQKCTKGITLTAPGFYAPQGRKLRYNIKYNDIIERFQSVTFDGLNVTNLEMECSGIYGLGKMLGHNVTTVCTVVAQRVEKTFSRNAAQSIDNLIQFVVEKLSEE